MYHYKFDYPLTLITYSKIDGGWITLEALKQARALRKKNKSKRSKLVKLSSHEGCK